MMLDKSRVERFYEFMTERENIRLRRALGWPREKWTLDPIFQKYSFTNVKREHDRTSTLLRQEFYDPWVHGSEEDNTDPMDLDDPDMCVQIMLNCVLFRYFGTIEAAQTIGWTENWGKTARDRILGLGAQDDLKFTAAYIIPACGRSEPKHQIVVDIIDGIEKRLDDVIRRDKWEQQCRILSSCYGCGSFMAKEILLDYFMATGIRPVDWQTWSPVGPGGRRGASRVLHGAKLPISETEALEVIREIYSQREEYWREDFVDLDLTDIQFQMCEFDKKSRVAEGRAPKRRFKPTIDAITKQEES